MKFKSFGYCFVQGIKNIGRNRIFSLASAATMTLCIFLIGVFYSITSNINYNIDNISQGLCIKVFFQNDITEERLESIKNTIYENDIVTDIHYTSAEEAWEQYKQKYFGDYYNELADAYENDNPLINSASYEVYFNDPSAQKDLVDYISKIDGVRKANSSDNAANGLSETGKLVNICSVFVIVLLIAVALFLINNTISIGISVRSDEISIMRLLGAKNSFIRAPFIVEGILLGLIGAVIPIIIVYFAYDGAIRNLLANSSFLSGIIELQGVGAILKLYVPVALILGIGIGLIGSMISLAKHLKA